MNKQKILYKRALIMCSIALICAVILKLVGSSIFTIDTNIPVLNQLESVVMNSPILSFIYSALFTMINIGLITSIITKSNTFIKHMTLLLFLASLSVIAKNSIDNEIVVFILDSLIPLLIISMVQPYSKELILRYIVVCILTILYQLISLFIRNLGIQIGEFGFTNSIIYMIDYYLMLIITYLYSRTEVIKNV